MNRTLLLAAAAFLAMVGFALISGADQAEAYCGCFGGCYGYGHAAYHGCYGWHGGCYGCHGYVIQHACCGVPGHVVPGPDGKKAPPNGKAPPPPEPNGKKAPPPPPKETHRKPFGFRTVSFYR